VASRDIRIRGSHRIPIADRQEVVCRNRPTNCLQRQNFRSTNRLPRRDNLKVSDRSWEADAEFGAPHVAKSGIQ
jgi:hypothetical protein